MQSTLSLYELPKELWELIAFEVSNWKSFILVCKLFSLFNTEKLKLLKYCKVKSFRNRYPNIMSIRPGKHISADTFNMLPSYEVFSKELKGSYDLDEECLRDTCLARVNLFKNARTVGRAYDTLLQYVRNDLLCLRCLNKCVKLLALRDDLTYEDASKIISKGLMAHAFSQHVCSNLSLNLDEVIALSKVIGGFWVTLSISKRPDVTYEVTKSYPRMFWDYNYILGCTKVSIDDIDEVLMSRSKRCCPCLSTNYNLTWEDLRYFKDNEQVSQAVSFIVHREATYERILQNLGEVIDNPGFYLEVLLNPILTFQETEALFRIKLKV